MASVDDEETAARARPDLPGTGLEADGPRVGPDVHVRRQTMPTYDYELLDEKGEPRAIVSSGCSQ